MSTLSAPESAAESAKTKMPSYSQCAGARHFWLRRLHSLVGLVFGGYVTVHLLVNATGFFPRMYQQNVDKIHDLEPMLPFIEIAAIFGPLLFHMLYGIYASREGLDFSSTLKYNYGGNYRYYLQRVTAIILVAFIAWHVGTLHKWGLAALGVPGFPQFNPKNLAYQSTAHAIKEPFHNPAANAGVWAFYLLGVWSATFHFANGLWTAAIAWGLTVTAAAQRRWGHVCCAFGIILTLAGTAAWASFTVFGQPNLSIEATKTLPEEISEEVHGQASGGKDTGSHVPANQLPASEKPQH